MLALPCVDSPLSLARFEEAACLHRAARRAGFTVRSGVDCLIAACAIRHGLTVLHKDRDYGVLAKVAPLMHRDVAARRSASLAASLTACPRSVTWTPAR